ncbi:chaperone modulatory protein CbpM [Tranquillimonas rosea]|uniref:Chaperone modulatory protein CbpM n=1 Tax=Tranquillimonas rosea TaxID=641238 RepID=A0A1H9P419_9RHOB|nr:MerR family transcriptional regulator [Tranquillimonas rosea]SER42950.1 chaperone modulatory protein CbpM [Tranquillimonas rosea]
MSLDERTVVARVERLTLRDLRLWVRRGWVRPERGERGPVFDEVDVARLRLLCDLRKDMAIPADILPVVLTLIDRLHETRRELRTLTTVIDEQPDAVRRTIAESVRARRQ